MFSFHGAGEYHGNRDLRISKRWFKCGWWWGIGLAIRDLKQWYASGGDYTWGVHCPTLQDENPRSGLNWLCLEIASLKVLFCERGLSPGWKPMIYDRATTGLCTVSFLKVLLLEKLDFWCCLGGGCLSLLQGIDHCSGTFLFCISSSVFWLCASVMPLGHFVIVEARCNWYLPDINIYSLSKNEHPMSFLGGSRSTKQWTLWTRKTHTAKLLKGRTNNFIWLNFVCQTISLTFWWFWELRIWET
jgi:hypothetical protein